MAVHLSRCRDPVPMSLVVFFTAVSASFDRHEFGVLDLKEVIDLKRGSLISLMS